MLEVSLVAMQAAILAHEPANECRARAQMNIGTIPESLHVVLHVHCLACKAEILSGALASMIGTMDEDDCDSKEKVRYLELIQYKYNLPLSLFYEIKNSL